MALHRSAEDPKELVEQGRDLVEDRVQAGGAVERAGNGAEQVTSSVEHVTDERGRFRVERGLLETLKSTARNLHQSITPFQGLLEAPRSVAAVYQKHQIALGDLVLERDQLLSVVFKDLGVCVMDQLQGVTWRDLEMLGAVREQAASTGGSDIGA